MRKLDISLLYECTNYVVDTKQTRVVKKTVPTESFFNFFAPPEAPTDEEDATSDVEERLELDYQLGEDIKGLEVPFRPCIVLTSDDRETHSTGR